MFYDYNINPDLIEIILQNMFHEQVTSGYIAVKMQTEHLLNKTDNVVFPYKNPMFWKLTSILEMANATNGIGSEYFLEFYKDLRPEGFNSRFDTLLKTKFNTRLRVPDIDIEFAKFSDEDRLTIDLYQTQFAKLVTQTSNLSPKELGERIVLVPGNIPKSFDEFKNMFLPILPVKINIDELENTYIFNADMDQKAEFMRTHNLFFNNQNKLEQHPFDTTCLTEEQLEKYHETYDLIINVDIDHRQLYTRGRFFINMFIELSDFIKMSLMKSCYNINNLDLLNTFLGEKLKPILKYYALLRLDIDGYPVFSRLYTDGSIVNLTHPKSWNIEAQLCYKSAEERISYSLHLYEGKNGLIYLIVVLEDIDYLNFITYFKNQKCIFDLFLHSEFRDVVRRQNLYEYRRPAYNILLRFAENCDSNFNLSIGIRELITKQNWNYFRALYYIFEPNLNDEGPSKYLNKYQHLYD